MNSSTGAGSIFLESIESAGDERLLSRDETAFIFLRGESEQIEVLLDYEEVFGRNQKRLKVLKILPTNSLGATCRHCEKPIEDPENLVLVVQKAKPLHCIHETCFRKWFIALDKGKVPSYRFLKIRRVKLRSRDDITKLIVDGRVVSGCKEIFLVDPMDFKEIRKSSQQAAVAMEERRLLSDDRPGVNLFLCPRCTAPQEIPFLETEDKVHECKKCKGLFKVIVKEVKS